MELIREHEDAAGCLKHDPCVLFALLCSLAPAFAVLLVAAGRAVRLWPVANWRTIPRKKGTFPNRSSSAAVVANLLSVGDYSRLGSKDGMCTAIELTDWKDIATTR